MIDEKLISVIIPTYNNEKYISRCINSVLSQTYKNIEIMVIDDGSKDNTKNIIKKYTDKYKNVKYYYKTNNGVSSARNYGIKKSVGEYITFVDSDDYIDKRYIEKLVHGIEINNADLSITTAIDFDDNKCNNNFFKINNDIILKNDDIFYSFFKEDKYTSVCWGKLYKRDLLLNIKFDTKMRIAEDCKFLLDYLHKCNSIVILKDNLYFYYLNKNGTIRSDFSDKWFDEINWRYSLYLSDKYKKFSIELLIKYISINMNCLLILKNIPLKDKIQMKKNIIRYYKLLFNGKFKLKNKIKFMFALLN